MIYMIQFFIYLNAHSLFVLQAVSETSDCTLQRILLWLHISFVIQRS